MNTKTIEEYLALPYTIEIVRDEGQEYTGWYARVLELPGCMTQADDFAELDHMLQDAMRLWIETALEDGLEIPEPRPIDDYSGKFVLRLPKSLHRDLVLAAEREGVSLNAYVNVALARAVSQSPQPQAGLEPALRYPVPNPDYSYQAGIAEGEQDQTPKS